MPIDKYLPLRKAVEIEEVNQRLIFISDVSSAFFGGKDHIQNLQKYLTELEGVSEEELNWKPDSDWKSRLLRFKR